MKNKLIIFSVIILVSIMIAGGTMAWFTSSPEASFSNFDIGIVEVEVVNNGLEDIKVKNIGTTESYIRVRFIPQWSNPNLSISNIIINCSNDWTEKDGYYYYSQPLKQNELTSNISIEIDDYSPEYEGATFKIKIVAEGVQSTYNAWKNVWSINSLTF